MSCVVRCQGVQKSFSSGEQSIPVLRGIDFELASGGMTMLTGPSGCGKTTLLTIIAAMLQPDGGRVEVAGLELSTADEAMRTRFRRSQIGFVYQQYNLLPALTAAENAAIPLVIAGQPMSAAAKRARLVLERLGMQEHIGKLPRQLSGGQQQRVAIARALVHEPSLVVCDEPTAALDAECGQDVIGLLREAAVQPGRAVLVVTHDSRILHFADCVARMDDGRIAAIRKLPAAQATQVGDDDEE